jgi:hypothetical protein
MGIVHIHAKRSDATKLYPAPHRHLDRKGEFTHRGDPLLVWIWVPSLLSAILPGTLLEQLLSAPNQEFSGLTPVSRQSQNRPFK